jgi:hypothetical protein
MRSLEKRRETLLLEFLITHPNKVILARRDFLKKYPSPKCGYAQGAWEMGRMRKHCTSVFSRRNWYSADEISDERQL